LAAASRTFFGYLDIHTPEKILVYHVGNIGDIIVATPVYRSIRNAFPEAKISLLTSPGKRGLPGGQEIITPLNLFDEIKVYYPEEITHLKKVIGFLKDIREAHYDFLVYLPANQWGFKHILRDMIFFRLTGIRCAIGFEIYEGYHNYRMRQQVPVSEVERLKNLITPLNLASYEQNLEFPIVSEDRYFADSLFKRKSIEGTQPKIIVHPGGKKPSKLWAQQNFSLLINKLIEEIGAQVVLVGSKDEIGMADAIIAPIKHKVANLAGELTLPQLAAVIERADIMVSSDSGPMHIATAVGTPVVALFSGADIPYVWYPYGDMHTVVRKDVECSPCFRDECAEHTCMKGITVEEVFQAVNATLEKRLRAND